MAEESSLDGQTDESSPDGTTVEERLTLLEDQVATLLEEAGRPDTGTPRSGRPAARDGDPASRPAGTDLAADEAHDPYALLHVLQADAPSSGAVSYVGSVDVGLGHIDYQWGRPTDALLAADWAERADALAALGHPLRLAILRLLLDAERTVSEIVDALDLASTGVAYHHLHQLQGAGWVVSPRRGAWTVPPSRIVPLLAIVLAAEET